MLEKKFIDKIEELRHHTFSRITKLQRELCPMVKDIYMNYQFEYWYEGYKYNLWEDNKHLYAVKELPYCYDNELKNTTFMDTADHLITDGKMWPFLLFIEGEAVQWSKIYVIHDYDYSYIKIDDVYPDHSFYAYMVVFPIPSKQVRYGEDSNVLTNSNRKGLYFKDGKRLESTDFEKDINIRLEILDEDIYFNIVDLSQCDGTLEFEGLPVGYIPQLENILTFNDDGTFNSFGPFSKIETPYNGAFNLFKVIKLNPQVKWAILMYNTKHCKQAASMYDRLNDLNQDSIIKFLKNNNDESSELWRKVITPLIRNFDFDHDLNKSYDENIKDAVKYITRYDFRIWRDMFIKDLHIKSFYYSGAEFKKLADDKGYIHFSRNHGNLIEDVAIMFVNHRLYQYMIDVTYINNTINLPIFGIQDDDHVEVLLFTECNNNILDITIPDNKTPVYIHPEYNLDDCYLMSDYCPDSEYTVPDSPDGRKQYNVEFGHESSNNGYLVKFKNPEYYGRALKVVPKRQFRYYRYKFKENQSKFVLPTQFNYCHDPDRYLIFINGKKIDKTEYAITFMNKWRPFDRLILYVSTILDPGDYIDIFYIPELLVEKYKQASMPKNGLLMLNDENGKINYPNTYPMTKDTVMVFINGLKVNPLDIKDVSLNTLLINMDDYKREKDGSIAIDGEGNQIRNNHQVDSIDNITIMEFVPGNKEIAGYLKGIYDQLPPEEYDPEKFDFSMSTSDDWKDLIKILINKEVDGADLETIFGKIYSIENPDASYKENFADLRSILYDAILEYYLATKEATTGTKFIYDFERDNFEDDIPFSNTKIINVFPDKDKLFDYQPAYEETKESDVAKGKTFRDPII